jgi:quaternary ammonium compound-resistance protein SugE
MTRRSSSSSEPEGASPEHGLLRNLRRPSPGLRHRCAILTDDVRESGAWFFLSVSALFEVAWVFSLKLCDGAARVGPLTLYAASGLGAAVFLSLAMRSIPMGVAYAVWMGLSLIGTLAVDAVVFHEPWNLARTASVLLIVAGACGLKLSGAS